MLGFHNIDSEKKTLLLKYNFNYWFKQLKVFLSKYFFFSLSIKAAYVYYGRKKLIQKNKKKFLKFLNFTHKEINKC